MKERLFAYPLSLIEKARRNHAVEHATLILLAKRGYPLSGLSDWRGFFILGKVPTELLFNAIQTAIERLNAGERNLAVHPNCGTNYAACGAAAGVAAWLAMTGANSARKRWSRLPLVMAFSTLAFIISQPLGPWLQKNVTTNAVLDELKVTGIILTERKHFTTHRVYIKHGEG